MSKASAVEWRRPPSWLRLLAAAATVAIMWLVAAVAVAGFILTPLPARDEAPNESYWSLEGLAWLSVAVALLVGTGPAAHAIGRRRWLLVLPLLGAALWAAGGVAILVTERLDH